MNDEGRKRIIAEQKETIDRLLDKLSAVVNEKQGLRKCITLMGIFILILIALLALSVGAEAQARDNTEKKYLSRVCYGQSNSACMKVNDGQGYIQVYRS